MEGRTKPNKSADHKVGADKGQPGQQQGTRAGRTWPVERNKSCLRGKAAVTDVMIDEMNEDGMNLSSLSDKRPSQLWLQPSMT